MVSTRSVLIVDSSEENREVLRTALERKGCKILATSRAKHGLQLAQQHHPDVIVLDLELTKTSAEEFCAPFAQEENATPSQLVILGTVKCSGEGRPKGEFVAKPYHYAPLIRRIEQLLDAAGQSCARCA